MIHHSSGTSEESFLLGFDNDNKAVGLSAKEYIEREADMLCALHKVIKREQCCEESED